MVGYTELGVNWPSGDPWGAVAYNSALGKQQQQRSLIMWKRGPLPKDTYGWGGVTLTKQDTGFFFADFCGDHVKIRDGNGERKVMAAEVCQYDNSLTLPPKLETVQEAAERGFKGP